MVSIIVL